MWGASVEAKLGPIGVSAEFNYGIEVIAPRSGAWQIGLIVQVIGKADIFIVKVSIKLELMAAIARQAATRSRQSVRRSSPAKSRSAGS